MAASSLMHAFPNLGVVPQWWSFCVVLADLLVVLRQKSCSHFISFHLISLRCCDHQMILENILIQECLPVGLKCMSRCQRIDIAAVQPVAFECET